METSLKNLILKAVELTARTYDDRAENARLMPLLLKLADAVEALDLAVKSWGDYAPERGKAREALDSGRSALADLRALLHPEGKV